ncbi:unnamed protein product [Linum trigynum]|uniref:Uncharacterized protein n=1 Tax=Linum trigynum TaxID=586398 RepID=A0AAV2DF04_9ROSI
MWSVFNIRYPPPWPHRRHQFNVNCAEVVSQIRQHESRVVAGRMLLRQSVAVVRLRLVAVSRPSPEVIVSSLKLDLASNSHERSAAIAPSSK